MIYPTYQQPLLQQQQFVIQPTPKSKTDVCTICNHVVADHFYTYIQDEEEQSYNMECLLCGAGCSQTLFAASFQDLKSNPNSDTQLAEPQQEKVLDLGAALGGAGMNKLLQASEEYSNNHGDDAEWE